MAIARYFKVRQRNFSGEHFGARDYFVITVDLDEDMVEYIHNQEENNESRDLMKLGLGQRS